MAEDPQSATVRLAAEALSQRSVDLRQGHLIVVEGPDRGRRFTFRSPGMRIGKGEANDVVLTDQTISRSHLRIDENEGGFIVRDLESTNGTYMAGTRIREAYLQADSVILIGQTTLRFEPPGKRVPIMVSSRDSFGRLLGRSLRMREVFGILERVAPTELTLLITGETGCGKEMVAASVHEESPRRDRPFIVFDCSAVSPELVESALFGHQPGAFTGAAGKRAGAFQSAQGGTLFIDEVGELRPDLQPKLLRALEMRTVQPLGSDVPIPVDVRIVAATHRKLKEMVAQEKFRRDLFYRLSVVEVRLPTLAERREDIPFLAESFLRSKDGVIHQITSEALRILAAHTWEGNVRELRNVLDRAVAFAGNDAVDVEHLALEIAPPDDPAAGAGAGERLLKGDRSLEDVEVEVIRATLQKEGWNRTRTAQVLGINRKTLVDKMQRHGIVPPDDDGSGPARDG